MSFKLILSLLAMSLTGANARPHPKTRLLPNGVVLPASLSNAIQIPDCEKYFDLPAESRCCGDQVEGRPQGTYDHQLARMSFISPIDVETCYSECLQREKCVTFEHNGGTCILYSTRVDKLGYNPAIHTEGTRRNTLYDVECFYCKES
ncbi:hypothetical protein EDB81DRAFT_756299 [Dactylonectria macrodidyma]|uniref:Apple domain-containing protein n=1 Tax=Dactylonectria macrodidyma TaxID=307937 RepID=A0A9P9FHY4_9HYPO|nr:hypothetical protein EDB81DRAFT_756299 [Dactylonectria macrodidyma]